MQYTVNRGEKGKVEVRVDIPAAGFSEAYGEVLAKFGQETTVEGFRPGKAPTDLVEGKVGANRVLNETASFLIGRHLSEIFKKEDLVPLDSPKIAIDSLAKGSPFSFAVTFTNKPKVTVSDWKKIKAKKVKAKEITEEDVNKSIENIYEAWRERSQSQSDKSKSEEKEEGEEESGKYIYDAHGNKVFFDKKTLRSSSNQDSTAGLKVFLKDEKGSPSINAQGKIDDEFAKAIGARDLAHLRELVRKDLETIVADQVEAKFEQEIFDQIAELGQVEALDILVEDELNRMLVRLTTMLERDGKKIREWLAEQKTTIEELKAKWRPQAEKNVKITLVMNEIGRQEKVQVAPEEIEKALTGVNKTNLTEEQKRDLENYAAANIFQAKTLDLVKKAVTA